MATTKTGLQAWERKVPLSAAQRQALADLGAIADVLPLPDNLPEDPGEQEGAGNDATQGGLEGSTEIESAQQFYTWFANVQDEVEEERQAKHRDYLTSLYEYREDVGTMKTQIEGVLACLDDLSKRQEFVSTKTTDLYDACEALVKEKNDLVNVVDSIRTRLAYFDELNTVAKVFNAPTVDVTSEAFLSMLTRLDECINYVASNPHFRDSAAYLLRFRTLQNRGLTLVRGYTVSALQAATKGVLDEMEGSAKKVEAVEGSPLYLAFRKLAPDLKILTSEIESRSGRPEYASLLESCHACYYEQRLVLLTRVIQPHVQELMAADMTLTALTREGCMYLLRVCEMEYNLFSHFFSPAEHGISSRFFSDGVGAVLYEELRPEFIQLHDMDTLSDLCSLLKVEVLDEHIQARGESAFAFKPLVRKILGDVQGRLTFRAQIYIRDNITGFNPTAEQLDYPALMDKKNLPEGAPANPYLGWYPTLETTLSILSKLYRSVDLKTFESLAQEAVSECTASLLYASELIGKQKGRVDAHLFLIKHLLILREQISPFDVDFAAEDKSLDFSSMSAAWSNLSGGSLFSFSRENGLFELLGHAAPTIARSQVDSKKTLERELKEACEAFIVGAVNTAMAPTNDFLDKAKKLQEMTTAAEAAGKSTSSFRDTLVRQPFAATEHVAVVVTKTAESLQESLQTLGSKMAAYLDNAATQGILFRPIKAKILDAYKQMRSVVEECYSEKDREAIAVPSDDAVASMVGKATGV